MESRMNITKPMVILFSLDMTKTGFKTILSGSLLLINSFVCAQTGSDHIEHHPLNINSVLNRPDHSNDINHFNDHGGQIYQSTEINQTGVLNDNGDVGFKVDLETRIGTDENKIFIKYYGIKAESESFEFDTKLLYSRNISDFWDAQLGLRYSSEHNKKFNDDHWKVVLGLHGLAPYFFENNAYLYLGKEQQVSLAWEIERDFLLTQKFILKPFLNADLVLSDQSEKPKKKGFESAELGLEARYEITKKLMPYASIEYAYKQSALEKNMQYQVSQKNWIYGVGLRLKF